MRILVLLAKIFVILLSAAFVAVPFVIEFLGFKWDKKNKTSHKRLGRLLYTAIYVLLLTTILCIFHNSLFTAKDHSLIRWLTKQVALSGKISYTASVFATFYTNFAVGMYFILFGVLVRLGLKKVKETNATDKGIICRFMQLEKRAVSFFNTETWFFVGKILKYFSLTLSAIYLVTFLLYLIPGIFTVEWLPRDFIFSLFNSGYLYPSISLIGLWEAYYFIEGIRAYKNDSAETSTAKDETPEAEISLEAIDAEVKKRFKDFYVCDVELSQSLGEELSVSPHNPITEYICRAIENDSRNKSEGKEIYLNCVDKLTENSSLLINGSFFSDFSPYFLRYLSVIIARGDNVVFVCNSNLQVEDVYEYLYEGLSQLSSLYCPDFRDDTISFDNPIWKIAKIAGKQNMLDAAALDDASILVTSLSYLCSKEFETEHTRFIHLLDTIVFVNASETVNTYNRQLAMLNTRLKHITKNNALLSKNSKNNPGFSIRYMSKDVRYICFDDTRSPGLDKVLKNMLAVNFDSVDAMQYSAKTLVRCYNYEAAKNENGQRVCPQFLDTEENIDALMNMAFLCLSKGADSVDVFVEGAFPFENISESIAANRGQITINADLGNIHVNRHRYNPEGYNVIIALDTGDNLPVALRRYVSMVSGKPALIIVFSKPYLFRDYYASSISSNWRSHQLIRIPVEEGTKKDIAQRIVIKANAGGISEEEILHLASGVPQFDEFVKKRDVNAILRAILEIYGLPQEDRINIFSYFEYASSRDFDENGLYSHEDKVLLRQRGKLYDLISGADNAVLINGDEEIPLSIPRRRISQRYIAGQNLIYEGNIYFVQKIDMDSGKIYVKLAMGGKNEEAYQYIQKREYRVALSSDVCESAYPTKHVVLGRNEDNVTINDVYVSAFRAPAEVLTRGYYKLDPQCPVKDPALCEYYSISDEGNDFLAKQSYRRYGSVTKPVYSTERVLKETELIASQKGALMMAVRITGTFGADVDKIASLGGMLLNETLKAIFPSVAEELVVFPVLSGALSTEDAKIVLSMQPELTIVGNNDLLPSGELTFLIVEDSDTDLGVVSVLMSSGDDVIKTLFSPVNAYLSWYLSSENKGGSFFGGLDHEPDCFDVSGLSKVAKLLGDAKQNLHFVELDSIVEYGECDFCGRRCKKSDELFDLDDGRKMCNTCKADVVGDNKELLKELVNRATMFLESTYCIELNDAYEYCFEATMKIINSLKQSSQVSRRNFDIPLYSFIDTKKVVHLENSIPSVSLSELLIRELIYTWQQKYAVDVSPDLKEGQMALVIIQYLRFLNENNRADARATYYESAENVSGEGYRRLVKELLENPQYNNNPFLLLSKLCGTQEALLPEKTRRTGNGDFGKAYVPAAVDRSVNGEPPYFYYSRLSDDLKAIYDQILTAILSYQDTLTINNCSFDDLCRISRAITYDRPEIFWYDSLSVGGNQVTLQFCATPQEVDSIQKQIDDAVPKFLEGLDDSMSAYDVALRIHDKLMQFVDYDTVALNLEKETDESDGKIDYLRTICGVFLNGRAVCAGYAKAAAYLLRKCGVDCGIAAGHTKTESGEQGVGHAWNILKIDGDYYYVDTTWDDNSDTIQTVKRTDTGFDYFCITTEEILRTRAIDMCPVEMPLCTAIKANYYHHNDLILGGYDLEKIEEIAIKAAKNQEKGFTFKCNSDELYDQAFERLISRDKDCYSVLKCAAKINKHIFDSKYNYTYNKKMRTITVFFKFKNS